jgi:hypothetical protein
LQPRLSPSKVHHVVMQTRPDCSSICEMWAGGIWRLVRGFLSIQARSQDYSISLPLDAKPAGCRVRRLSTGSSSESRPSRSTREHFLAFVTKAAEGGAATLNRSSGLTSLCCPQVQGTSTNNPCALWASQSSSPSSKAAKPRRQSWTFSGGTNGKEQPPRSHRED